MYFTSVEYRVWVWSAYTVMSNLGRGGRGLVVCLNRAGRLRRARPSGIVARLGGYGDGLGSTLGKDLRLSGMLVRESLLAIGGR